MRAPLYVLATVTRKELAGDALYIAWRTNAADANSARSAKRRLAQGEGKHLYRLRSWVIVNGEGRALLAPGAPLEQIAGAVSDRADQMLSSRWIAGSRACAELARDIERMPVVLGLADRPEQWPYSSAAMK